MKDKVLIVKVDDEFTEKVDYLQRINDYKNRSDTVRKVVEKEYNKEHMKVATCPYRKDFQCKLSKSISFCNIDWTRCAWALKEQAKEEEDGRES